MGAEILQNCRGRRLACIGNTGAEQQRQDEPGGELVGMRHRQDRQEDASRFHILKTGSSIGVGGKVLVSQHHRFRKP